MIANSSDLSFSTDSVDPISKLDGRDAAFRKAEFVEPKLTFHGDLVDLTAPFGGSITP